MACQDSFKHINLTARFSACSRLNKINRDESRHLNTELQLRVLAVQNALQLLEVPIKKIKLSVVVCLLVCVCRSMH